MGTYSYKSREGLIKEREKGKVRWKERRTRNEIDKKGTSRRLNGWTTLCTGHWSGRTTLARSSGKSIRICGSLILLYYSPVEIQQQARPPTSSARDKRLDRYRHGTATEMAALHHEQRQSHNTHTIQSMTWTALKRIVFLVWLLFFWIFLLKNKRNLQ